MHDLIGGRESADEAGGDRSWWDEDLAGPRLELGRNPHGGDMLNIEQTEFWTETAAPRLRATMPEPIPSAAEDYFLDDDFEREPMLDAGASEVLEAIVVPEDDASLDVSESIDAIERRLEANRAERKRQAEPVASPPDPAATPALSRPRGTVARRTFAQQDAPQPRFNMTRLLRLTGALDAVDDRQHWYDLPGRHFRAIFTLRARGPRISRDFLKDLSAPPCGVSPRQYSRSEGWLTRK